ncbi:MAG TPA: response regulator transcription factor [Thermomicrobiales bacterium]
MTRILVVDDDAPIADLVRLYLRREGHDVEVVTDGVAALRRVEDARAEFDVVVLDLMLPGLDGRGVCRRIRRVSEVPIIMLTALDDDRDKLEGFDLGADDYLTKPFNPLELGARVRALLRRSARQSQEHAFAPSGETICLGNARIELDTRRFLVNQREIPLRAKEFDLPATFARRPGVVWPRDQLLDAVWGGIFDGDTCTVDVHVSRLRDRLEDANAPLAIETVRSIGYRLALRH